MTLLAAPSDDTVVWLVSLAVVAAVLVGVVAVTVILVRVLRSVTFGLRELGELRQVLDGRVAQQNSGGGHDPSAAAAAEGEQAVGGGEGKDTEPGGARGGG